MGRKLKTTEARKLAAASWSEDANRQGAARGGRPLSAAPRCPCGAFTLHSAQLRADKTGPTKGKGLGHDPTCSFYKERAIIV